MASLLHMLSSGSGGVQEDILLTVGAFVEGRGNHFTFWNVGHELESLVTHNGTRYFGIPDFFFNGIVIWLGGNSVF